jgi:hypothetical protein
MIDLIHKNSEETEFLNSVPKTNYKNTNQENNKDDTVTSDTELPHGIPV